MVYVCVYLIYKCNVYGSMCKTFRLMYYFPIPLSPSSVLFAVLNLAQQLHEESSFILQSNLSASPSGSLQGPTLTWIMARTTASMIYAFISYTRP